jgi:hypothetical protein
VLFRSNDVAIDTIAGLTLPVNGLADGSYTFKVVAVDSSGNKSAASSVAVSLPVVGIKVTEEQPITVYPNPANNILNIKNAQVGTVVNIYSISGQFVITNVINSDGTIDISSLQSGIYTLQLSNADATSVIKLIKK